MPSLRFDIIVDNKGGKVAMKQFASETDAAFKRSAASVRRVSLGALPEHERSVVKVQRKYQSLNTQIDKLAKSGRITNQMAASFHNDVAIRMKGDLKTLEKQGSKTFKALSTAAKAASAAVVIAGALMVKSTTTAAFKAVEDYKIKVASLSAFITTFSQKTADGDLAGGFKDANAYAERLVVSLEKIDAKTIATGKDLGVMAETMAQNGLLIDINNEKQVAGFTNIANALKLVTAGQNQDIQMRQEINALLKGQIRATDRLPTLLKKADPLLEKHLKLWKEQGTIIENVGDLLQGFGASAALIEETWAAVGTSLETVRDRVLRDGFKPIYQDILTLANAIKSSLVESGGELTPLATKIQTTIGESYRSLKLGAMGVKAEILRISMLLDKVGGTMTFIASLPSAIPAALGIDSSEARMESLAKKNIMYEDRYAENERKLLQLATDYNNIESTPFTLPAQNTATAPKLAPQIDQEGKKVAATKATSQAIKEQAEAQRVLNLYLSAQNDIVNQVVAGEETLSIAVMTSSQKEISAITAKYDGYDRLIQQQVDAGNQTEAWANKTHNILGTRMQEDLDALKTKGVDVADKMKDAFVGWANGMSGNLTDMVWSAELSFASILESFGKMLTQMVIQYMIVQPLLEGLMSFGGFSSTGSIGMTAGVDIGIAHAAGGYDVPAGQSPVTRLHEKEMVLPAKYADMIRNGSMGGGGQTNVIINNNSKAQASATEIKNADGGKDILVMIEEAVGNSIMSGRGKINKAMRTTFGATNVVVGR